jgi:hypothetical protein
MARVCESGTVTVLAEQLQGFLNRTIGEREQDGLVRGFVDHRLPAPHDENIPGPPLDDEIRADPRPAATFDRDEDPADGSYTGAACGPTESST